LTERDCFLCDVRWKVKTVEKMSQGFTMILTVLGAPADDPNREARAQGLTETICQARAAEFNRMRTQG